MEAAKPRNSHPRGGTADGTRSLSLFTAVDLGDPKTSLYRVYAEAGAVLKGTFPGRDNDTIGLAVTDTEVNISGARPPVRRLFPGLVAMTLEKAGSFSTC